MGLKAIIYFEIVTTIALVIGLLAVNLTKPGVGVVTATRRPAISRPMPRTGRAFCCT